MKFLDFFPTCSSNKLSFGISWAELQTCVLWCRTSGAWINFPWRLCAMFSIANVVLRVSFPSLFILLLSCWNEWISPVWDQWFISLSCLGLSRNICDCYENYSDFYHSGERVWNHLKNTYPKHIQSCRWTIFPSAGNGFSAHLRGCNLIFPPQTVKSASVIDL